MADAARAEIAKARFDEFERACFADRSGKARFLLGQADEGIADSRDGNRFIEAAIGLIGRFREGDAASENRREEEAQP